MNVGLLLFFWKVTNTVTKAKVRSLIIQESVSEFLALGLTSAAFGQSD